MSIAKIPADDFWVLSGPSGFTIVPWQTEADFASIKEGESFVATTVPVIELRCTAIVAKRFAAALTKAVERYEEEMGVIVDVDVAAQPGPQPAARH